MGRGLNPLAYFVTPTPTDVASVLKDLSEGQIVRFTIVRSDMEHILTPARTVSTYDYEPSVFSEHLEYRVIHTDFYQDLAQFGLRAISFIDTQHTNPTNHIDTWVITTDGYVREAEHFGLLYTLASVKIL